MRYFTIIFVLLLFACSLNKDDINKIKMVLIEKYNSIEDKSKLLSILKSQGKALSVDKINANMFTLETYILTKH